MSWAELRTGALRRGTDAEQALAAFCHFAIDELVPVGVEIAEIAADYRASNLSVRMPDALARVIESATGLGRGDAAAVKQQILDQVKQGDPVLGKVDHTTGETWLVTVSFS